MPEFRILGPFEVVEDNRQVALGGPRQRALLAILLLHRGEVVSSDRLIDELWGERPPATAAKTLQGYVSHLRKALGTGVLETRSGGYVLDPDAVDADRFEALVAEAREGVDARTARDRLGAALGLWRGEALADLAYEPFAQAEIARLDEARLAALEDRIDADLELGRHREVVAELESLVAQHPNRERLLAQRMLALYQCGRHADALAAYRDGCRRLRDELGLEPGRELRALERRILDHDPALAAQRAGALRTSRRGRRIAVAGALLLVAAAVAAAVVVLTGGAVSGSEATPNSVAAIDVRDNRVVADVPVGARPSAIAFGSGSLWVANLDDETVSRVDPGTLHTARTIPVGDPPTGVAATAGAVWVASAAPGRASVSVRRIDPRFDHIGRPFRLGRRSRVARGDRRRRRRAVGGAVLRPAHAAGPRHGQGGPPDRPERRAGRHRRRRGRGVDERQRRGGRRKRRRDRPGERRGRGPSSERHRDRLRSGVGGRHGRRRGGPHRSRHAVGDDDDPGREAPVGVAVGAGSVWVAIR